MDDKTLEYMGKRVDAARLLKEKIKDLKEKLHTIAKHEPNAFSLDSGSSFIMRIRGFNYENKHAQKRLMSVINKLVVDAIKEEIGLLKQELAEL